MLKNIIAAASVLFCLSANIFAMDEDDSIYPRRKAMDEEVFRLLRKKETKQFFFTPQRLNMPWLAERAAIAI